MTVVAVALETRKARLADARAICELINHFADREEMLHRSVPEVCENIRDFVVAVDDGDIVACCALHVNPDTWAEVKCLAVTERSQGSGLGTQLVNQCVDEA